MQKLGIYLTCKVLILPDLQDVDYFPALGLTASRITVTIAAMYTQTGIEAHQRAKDCNTLASAIRIILNYYENRTTKNHSCVESAT